ncbi:MAG: hypothetical protein FWD30_00740 [Dehalococcoidia bacterium]|nr:hypothetical protein [Dehalococcoidia bacterium]
MAKNRGGFLWLLFNLFILACGVALIIFLSIAIAGLIRTDIPWSQIAVCFGIAFALLFVLVLSLYLRMRHTRNEPDKQRAHELEMAKLHCQSNSRTTEVIKVRCSFCKTLCDIDAKVCPRCNADIG